MLMRTVPGALAQVSRRAHDSVRLAKEMTGVVGIGDLGDLEEAKKGKAQEKGSPSLDWSIDSSSEHPIAASFPHAKVRAAGVREGGRGLRSWGQQLGEQLG